ncbi:RidA family protein [Thermoleophilia bacterium SCSIO 60948]|nr:RidA family protein [Thermoleophilia bacterium SCSIO 60948]
MSDVGTRCVVETETAPGAIGPYSQAIQFGELLFCSGAIPLDAETGELVGDELAAQTTQCLRNLTAVCEAAGTGLERALRLTVYTTDLSEFATINEAYAEFFAADPPARAAVGVAQLPKGARVEIDAIVAIG